MGAQAEGQLGAQFAPADEGKSRLPTDLGRPHPSVFGHAAKLPRSHRPSARNVGESLGT